MNKYHFKEYKSILSPKNSMNIYRGCTHGCIYCDSRSKCYQINHDFEDIEIKKDAPQQLEREIIKRRKPCIISTGAMTDPYMPLEKEINYTRSCLEVIEKHSFGVCVLTKSDLVLRDLDILKKINEKSKAVVQMTLTTFDENLCKILEPNVCTSKKRFETLKILKENGIPTVVWLDPILPFINDTEENLRGILNYCITAKVYGIICFGMGLTLREGNREYFYKNLDKYFPNMKENYQRKYGFSYDVTSDNHKYLMKIFKEECRKHGIETNIDNIFQYLNYYPEKYEQLSFFE
ncbi:MAG: radical SAM protein [Clostridia bacterium]